MNTDTPKNYCNCPNCINPNCDQAIEFSTIERENAQLKSKLESYSDDCAMMDNPSTQQFGFVPRTRQMAFGGGRVVSRCHNILVHRESRNATGI
jgi:hypothetical protein